MFTESRVKREAKASSDLTFSLRLNFHRQIVLSNKSSVIERSIELDYRSFGNRPFDSVRLAKFYREFDYVRLSSAIERLVFDWVRLPNCSIRYHGIHLGLTKTREIRPRLSSLANNSSSSSLNSSQVALV